MDTGKVRDLINDIYGVSQILDFKRGVSGTIVVVVQNSKVCVLKIGETAQLRNTISQERERRALLEPWLGRYMPPEISYQQYNGYEVMQSEFVGKYNFHEVVLNMTEPSRTIVRTFAEILAVKKQLWVDTAEPFDGHKCLRDHVRRSEELAQRIQSHDLTGGGVLVGSCLEAQLVVNGKSHGTFRQLIDRLGQYCPAESCCLSHGDLNADNIVIADDGRWYIVDWEWAGHHDWIESISRILGWWTVMATSLSEEPRIQVSGRQVELTYALDMSKLVEQLIDMATEMGGEVAVALGEKDYRRKLAFFLATYYLRDLKFQRQRGRAEFMVPVIGEAIKAISE